MILCCTAFALLTGPFSPIRSQAPAPGLWTDIDLKGLDRTADPFEDLDRFANGMWNDTTEIPADQAAWSVGQMVKSQNQLKLKAILEEASQARSAVPNSTTGRLGTFYRSAMDEARIDREGVAPIQPLLRDIDEALDKGSIWQGLPDIYRLTTVFAPIQLETAVDSKNPKLLDLAISVSQQSLPERGYYSDADHRSQSIRDEFRSHMKRTFMLAGDSESRATSESDDVFEIEKAISAGGKSDSEPTQAIGVEGLNKLSKGWHWDALFERLHISRKTSIQVEDLGHLRSVLDLIETLPAAKWRSYFRWQLLRTAAPALSKEFADEDFRFNGSVLLGRHEIMPRWKRVVVWADSEIGEDLGREYVVRHFPESSRSKVKGMIKELMTTLKAQIRSSDWLSDAAKRDALKKLSSTTAKVGYPDKWRDYSGLKFADTSFVLNLLAAKRFNEGSELKKVGRVVSTIDWENSPQTINAYCNPDANEVVFSAGILQPPFFDPSASDEINFAQIGSVIGHELTHLFWWKGKDAAEFDRRASLIVNQYNAFTILDGLHVDGKLTLSEDIADIGGLKLAYVTWKRIASRQKDLGPVDGFTRDQRFFIAYAQSWRMVARPEAARSWLKTDVHAPARFRILAPLTYLPEFASAFGRQSVPREGSIW
ncbi:MAG: hypothetical protein GC165_06900 [Armatimonadetes bacterium]|nr:hypothetical protein [Armatimonadota bacterium]